jgi:hypothetical protein
MSHMQEMISSSKSVASPTRDTASTASDADFLSPEGKKRPACIPEPDPDLGAFLAQHNITRWWPQIHEKLGITSIADLQFIGKACEKYLTGLPALPVLRLTALANSKASVADSTASVPDSPT